MLIKTASDGDKYHAFLFLFSISNKRKYNSCKTQISTLPIFDSLSYLFSPKILFKISKASPF